MTTYSLFRHLGKAIFFGAYKDSANVTVFTAYFDASGNKRKTVLTVVGFVSRVKKWDRFNDEWSTILKSEGVSSMHMTDFASSQGEFASWKGQSERRREFITELARCIRRNTNKGFGSSVVLEDYKAVDAKFELRERVGSPYTLCMRAALGGLKKWAQKKNENTENMLIFVEQGDDDQSELIHDARHDGLKVIPLFKEDAVAFQAGDVAAWKFRTAIHNAAYEPLETIEEAHKILRSLEPVKGLVQKNGVFNKAALEWVCGQDNIPRRGATISA